MTWGYHYFRKPPCFFVSFQVFGSLLVFQEAKERREELQRLRHRSGEAKRSQLFHVLVCCAELEDSLYIWMFPKMVGENPPNHPFSIGFSIIYHPSWGTTILGNTHIYIYVHTSFCPGFASCRARDSLYTFHI